MVGPAQQIDKIADEKNIRLDVLTVPEWDNVNHIISGGPYLVKNSRVFVDTAAQKLGTIGGRNREPQSATTQTII